MRAISDLAGTASLAMKVVLPGLLLTGAGWPRKMTQQLCDYVGRAGFDQQDIHAVERAKALTVVQPTGEKAEVLIYGIIFINSSVHACRDLYRDIEDLAGKDGFLAVRRFSQPPRIEDLLTIKISRQNALRGFQGSVIRSVAVPRARRGIEAAPAKFKKQLESQ
jgi:hypothetical protein